MLHPTTTNAPSDNVREKGGVKIPQVATKSDSDKEIEDFLTWRIIFLTTKEYL